MSRQEVIRQVEALVAEHGLAIIRVEGEGEDPSFSYTVGLSAHDHPELVMVAIGSTASHRLLNAMGRRVARGEVFASGCHDDLLVNDYCLWLAPVPADRAEDVFVLAELWSGRPAEGMQVIAPDEAGHFPWQDDVDPAYCRQMVLDVHWRPGE